jgi:Protein of unknown function (DUF3016)
MNTTTCLCRWLSIGLAACAGLGLGLQAQAAGRADVRFIEPERYADIGWSRSDRDATLDGLKRHFERLAASLPDGQTLVVEVTDVDLAGETEPAHSWGVRVLRGRTDIPKMTLRYTLNAATGPLKRGDAQLSDMDYFFGLPRGDGLAYEKRMLDRWFQQTFGPASPAQATTP